MLEIGPFLDRKPRALSGGQRQRVAMGRAVVREPQAFLFDEPLSNLDAKLRVQMRLEIRRLHNRLKATSIFVTHDQVEAMTLADTVVVMNAGRVEQTGTPIDVYRKPASKFVATFIGSPAMNLVPGRIVEPGVVEVSGGGRLGYDAARFGGSAGQGIEIGVRPEDIEIAAAGAAHTVQIKREFVEELGATRLIHGLVGDNAAMVMAVPSATPLNGDATLAVAAPVAAVHLFDPASGASLRA
jgi:sn-glycerol 3-phosphate transport system ATP-binding protein